MNVDENLERIYSRFFDHIPFTQQQRKNGVQYTLSPQLGNGSIHRVTTYSGLELAYWDCHYDQPNPGRFTCQGQMVELQFAFSGKRYAAIGDVSYCMEEGKGSLNLLSDFAIDYEHGTTERIEAFGMGIPVSLFQYALRGMDPAGKLDFEYLRSGAAFRQMIFDNGLHEQRQIHILLDALRNDDYPPLLLESAALELLQHYMCQLLDRPRLPNGLSRDDLSKVKRAAEVLQYRMTEPPSLLELSRLVELNDFKLKKGFKACYDTTVYGYLRQIRLQHAMQLLRSGEMNVTGAATAVGYSNMSSFAGQFIRQYGVKPSSVRKLY
ncbi:helix-turn-helix domain-containing protein [Paenibacillus sp. WLX1005]|uniref:helix-turn-helix domain-containing protein n=1 Tax=Paenibacillus sp. WLX1005 TaxID=3243766 RepID=UPI003983FC63